MASDSLTVHSEAARRRLVAAHSGFRAVHIAFASVIRKSALAFRKIELLYFTFFFSSAKIVSGKRKDARSGKMNFVKTET